MKIVQEDRFVQITDYNVILDDGSVFPLDAWELVDLLDELRECDGIGHAITMSDKVGKKLEELGVAKTNSRGSCYYRGENLDKFYKELDKALYHDESA